MEKKMLTLAVSGDEGSFSEEAGLLYCSREGVDPKLMYAIDMEGVLARVENGEVERGIFPVVNSRGGLVQTAFEAMGRHHFTLVNELWLEVQQCLLVLQGHDRSTITQIVSHPQALSQCERYLADSFPGARQIKWEDTAKAARDLASGVLPPTTAVIAPARAAVLYDLAICERGIQDSRPNLTTFIIVSR